MALAYEAILGKPISELFGGMYEPIRAGVAQRAKLLVSQSSANGRQREALSRKESIEAIASR
jgi:hypothetical protein